MRSDELASAGRCRSACSVCFVALFAVVAPFAAAAQSSAQLQPGGVTGAKVVGQPTAVPPANGRLAPVIAEPTSLADSVHGDSSRTRFVVGLEKPTEFQVFSLANPNRVIVDMPEVLMQLPAANGDTPIGLVKSFYGGLSAPGKSRVVIAVTTAVVVEKAAIEKSRDGRTHHLVLDIVPVDPAVRAQQRKPLKSAVALSALGNSAALDTQPEATTLWQASVQPPLPKPAVRPELKAQKAFKQVVVIDPGHGGHDPGASKFGTIEKDVVLAFSLMLRDKLNATGRYKVLMTRDNDTFVELDARRDFGEKHNAALFIAVHADYAGAQARGATIYSLRDSVAKDLKRSAKGEVSANVLSASELAAVKQVDSEASGIVKSILTDFAERDVELNKGRTSVFARSVIDFMGGSTSLQNNPDRTAAFRVLKTAKVPAVLIELAYVTNRQDAANLKSDEWRDKVSGSIMTAIENYFSNQLARM